MFKYFMICVAIIILGAWIYYINWRSSIIQNLKHKVFYKKIKLDKRTISNEEIKQNFSYLKEELQSRNFKLDQKEFTVTKDFIRKLKYSDFRQKEMEQLLDMILEYMEIEENPELEVIYYSSKNKPKYAGLFYEETNKISIYINLRDDTYESVLSTLIHECAHLFLISKGIRKSKRRENEILTDLCTVYLGLGKQMYEGYKLRNKVLYIDEMYKYQNTNKVGYINPGDIKYAMKLKGRYKF